MKIPIDYTFPESFVWGAATSCYQIEGAASEDGKGPSIWDMFCRRPRAIRNNDTADVACDHYHRYEEDIALMRELGLQSYRFSISWPRVLPEGTGAVNAKGLDFYQRVVDGLLEAGIRPEIAIYVWDLPLALFHRGGWINRESADWFAGYTRLVVDTFSDRVSHWWTLNEPNVFIIKGYLHGDHAPGLQLPISQVLLAAHNVMLSHGRSVQVIRAHAKTKPHIGFVTAARKCCPHTETPSDIEAARKFTFSPVEGVVQNPAWWGDPIFKGHYPEDAVAAVGKDMPVFPDSDLQIISQPLDVLGFNCYGGPVIRAGEDGQPVRVMPPPGAPRTDLGWEVTPEVIYWATRFHHERYQIPMLIAENGLATADWVCLDGKVHDYQRIDYIATHLRQCHRLIRDGIPLEGYFHWSLMDYFEWAFGFSKRFGLIHIDYETLKRTPKDSFYYYREVIRTRGARLGHAEMPDGLRP